MNNVLHTPKKPLDVILQQKITSKLLIVLSKDVAGVNADIRYESLLKLDVGIKTTVWLPWMWTKAVELQIGIYFQPASFCRPPFAHGHF